MVTTELDNVQISHAVCGRVIRLRNSSKCTEYSKRLKANKFRKLHMVRQPNRLTGREGKSYQQQGTEISSFPELVTESELKRMKNPI